MTTLQCFVSSDARDQHAGTTIVFIFIYVYAMIFQLLSVYTMLRKMTVHNLFHIFYSGPITSLHYSLDGRTYATASKDGSVKVRLVTRSLSVF